jgi:hypothetical protein
VRAEAPGALKAYIETSPNITSLGELDMLSTPQSKSFCSLIAVALLASCLTDEDARADIVPILNSGGEVYDTTGGNVVIPMTPVPPGDGTGWNATIGQTPGDSAVEAIPNNSRSGTNRLAFGAIAASTVTTPEDAVLYQETSKVVSQGERYVLNFFGQGFFEYNDGVDSQSSFFGYLDGTDNIVQVDTMAHSQIVANPGNIWTEATHELVIGAGSPLIGENLVFGFFTSPADGGGFSAVDDVSLSFFPPGFSEGDVNNDGDVDFEDVEIIANFFYENVTMTSQGDLSGNGLVDFEDFRIWKDAAGFSGSLQEALAAAHSVPEPSTLVGLSALCLAALWGRRGFTRK